LLVLRNARAFPLLPAALASVSFGFVLVRVRVHLLTALGLICEPKRVKKTKRAKALKKNTINGHVLHLIKVKGIRVNNEKKRRNKN
jgi:hypothetical protein